MGKSTVFVIGMTSVVSAFQVSATNLSTDLSVTERGGVTILAQQDNVSESSSSRIEAETLDTLAAKRNDLSSITVGRQWSVPRNANVQKLTDQQIAEFNKIVQGKSLEEVAKIKSFSSDTYVERRKLAIVKYAEEHAGTDKKLDPQDVREFLMGENLGLYSSERIYTVPASKNRLQEAQGINLNIQSTAGEMSAGASYSGRTLGVDQQTTGESNGPQTYIVGSKFQNDYSKKTEIVTASNANTMYSESTGCDGNLQSTTGRLNVTRKEVYEKCFRSLDKDFYTAFKSRNDFGYLSAIPMLTSIINSDMKQVCMASYYQEGVWITARHCLTELKMRQGLKLIVENQLVPIIDIKRCEDKGDNCDVAFIKAKTQKVDASLFNLKNPNLVGVNWGSEIFVPGIEENDVLDSKTPQESFLKHLLWADVGRGYCKAFKIKKGCINHTCSTLFGFSGAPVYWIDKQNKKIQLIGIHVGASTFKACDSLQTNYAITSDIYSGAYQ